MTRLALAGLLLGCALCLAAVPSARAAEPDRLAAAQREGHVRWYTVLLVEEAARPLIAGFTRRYPGVALDFVRQTAPEIARMVMAEAAAGAPQADVFDGSITAAPLLAAGLVEPYRSPAAGDIAERYKDPEGYWTALLLDFNAVGYNTDLVPPAEVPRSYADLLDPRWHGRMIWSTRDGLTSGAGFVGNVLMVMGIEAGLDYLARLKQQQSAGIAGDGQAVLRDVVAGNHPIGLQIFTHHTVIERARGGHVDWARIEPVLGFSNNIGLVRNAPHPNAGKLLIDFILSVEGQTIIHDANHIPASSRVEAKEPSLKEGFQVNFVGPALARERGAEWQGIFDRLFR